MKIISDKTKLLTLWIEGVHVGHLKKVTEHGVKYYKVYARYKDTDELLVSVDNLREAKSFAEFHNTPRRWAEALMYANCFIFKSEQNKKKIREDYLIENWGK